MEINKKSKLKISPFDWEPVLSINIIQNSSSSTCFSTRTALNGSETCYYLYRLWVIYSHVSLLNLKISNVKLNRPFKYTYVRGAINNTLLNKITTHQA